jgi:D-sedoheptulose 7-phosphate isomerase
MQVVGFTGASGDPMRDVCDVVVQVPRADTPLIQQTHMVAGHIVRALIEQELAGIS